MIITKKSDYPAPINTPSGENIQEVLGLQAGDVQSHSLARIIIPPGKSSAPHFHQHTDESYLILAGTADMQINGVRFSLQPWEAVLIKPGEVHQIFNHGDEDLVFLAACVPAWQPGDSFEVKPDNSR
jgi:mannose-6-phosphate isomerase-like protein (cupin superfamily)